MVPEFDESFLTNDYLARKSLINRPTEMGNLDFLDNLLEGTPNANAVDSQKKTKGRLTKAMSLI